MTAAMKPKERNLRDLRAMLQELLDDVDARLDALDERNQKVDESLDLVKSYLDDLEEKADRQERVGGRGSGGTTLAIPITYNPAPEPGSSDMEMMNLRLSIEQLYQDGVYAYIEGRYGASTITIAAVVEGLLKYKLTEEGIDYGENCNLGCCIREAEETILQEDSDVLANAELVRDVRNDVIHLNPERGIPRSDLAKLGRLDRVEDIPPDEPVTVMDSDWNVRDVPMSEVSPHRAQTIYPYRNASIIVIALTKNIRDLLYGKDEAD